MKNLLDIKRPTIQASLALLIVFLIDIFSPLGIAVGVLYILCFFLICRENKRVIVVFAIITILLTIAKFVILLQQTTTPFAFYNRVITISVIIIITQLALRHRRLVDTINEERRIYINELKEMLFMTSHRVRKPIASCLGLMNLLETEQPMTIEELKKVVAYFKASALELDEFTKELTTFIDDIKTKDAMKNCA